jgi:hypothetical protein
MSAVAFLYIGEIDRLAAVGREGVAAVEFGPHEIEATNDNARTFYRKVIRIVRTRKAIHRNAGNALQRLGHRTVGERADILGGNRVDYRVAVALDVLSVGKTLADAGNDDLAGRPSRRGSHRGVRDARRWRPCLTGVLHLAGRRRTANDWLAVRIKRRIDRLSNRRRRHRDCANRDERCARSERN